MKCRSESNMVTAFQEQIAAQEASFDSQCNDVVLSFRNVPAQDIHRAVAARATGIEKHVKLFVLAGLATQEETRLSQLGK